MGTPGSSTAACTGIARTAAARELKTDGMVMERVFSRLEFEIELVSKDKTVAAPGWKNK
jgi:hypothetical protein